MPLSFFDLPRELRDEVYLQHFLRPGRYEIIGPHPPNHGRVKSYNPHFLRTTSQIYCEASPFLYRRTVFKLQAPHQSYQWINTIGPSNASQIREVQLESSFLTRDVDEAGQRIAAQTWAKVLRSMPGLHRLSFSYVDSNSNSWTKIIYQNDQKDLANALDSLHELRDISINGVLPLAMVNNKTYLETLILYDDMEAEEGRSIESYFDALPRLRHLSLRSKATIVSPGFFAHVSPLHTLQWILPANLQFTRLHLEGIVNRHSISLHELRLGNTRGQAEGDDRLEIEDFQWLVLSLPHLEKLYITNPHINSSLVAMVPTHVKCVTLGFQDNDPELIARQLKVLATRSPNLNQKFKLFYYAHSLKNDEKSRKWDSFHRAIRELRGKGFNIWSCRCMDIYDTDIHTEQNHQSGLIP